jgi:hypothetical protein
MLHVDGIAVHFRHRGIGAADREQRRRREEDRQRQKYAAVGLHALVQA